MVVGPIARVRSAPLAEIVQHTLELSDNEAAEVLSRQTAVATNRPASFTGRRQGGPCGAERARRLHGR